VLVATTDGVGTKLKLAKDLEIYDGIGIDLVAMCVNDLLCVGAEPLFFLDYYACGKLHNDQAVQVVKGMTTALADINCALIGGETAEMPGVYREDEFDLAGFSVGVVNRRDILDGSGIRLGNRVIGLASSGIHSNGYSLVRKIVSDANLDLKSTPAGFEKSLGETLLEPTRIYVKPVLQIRKQFPVLGLAHITGGGLLENIPRVLPKSCKVVLDSSAWTWPPVFQLLKEQGRVEASEMHRVFNCGVGMAMIVEEANADEIVSRLGGMGFPASVIGEVVARKEDEAQVVVK